MDTFNFIEEAFLQKFKERKKGIVGVELEFPLLNLNKKEVEKEVCTGLINHFLENGFKAEEYDIYGNPAFIMDKNGDVLSFDNSYNNFEFSMQYDENLCNIAERFYKLYNEVQKYLKKFNYTLTGMGTNPYKKYINTSHLDFPVYNMVWEFLKNYKDEKCHDYTDFPAYLSSVQTHLDIDLDTLPKAINLFSKIEFAKGLLFSNSPDFDGKGYICYRDFLWQKSAFSVTGNVGTLDETYENSKDITEDILNRTMFNRIRNGKYETFSPVKVKEYFNEENLQDIETYLSFKNIEVTRRGTLEMRGDCTQPVYDAFMPPAFNLGILYCLDSAMKVTEQFLKDNNINEKNSYLREKVSCGEGINVGKEKISEFLLKLIEISREGLKIRGLGEEKFLEGIEKRAEKVEPPAIKIINGNIDEIICEYAKAEK